MNLPKPKLYPTLWEASVDTMESIPVDTSSEMELDRSDDGIPPIKQTPHSVLGMTDGEMSNYLGSFASPTQLRKGLLTTMQTFLELEYSNILEPAMNVLRNYKHTPNQTLRTFFVVTGMFECAMR